MNMKHRDSSYGNSERRREEKNVVFHRLEPNIQLEGVDSVMASIAISLKRIADSLARDDEHET